jgi:hypothetical protein
METCTPVIGQRREGQPAVKHAMRLTSVGPGAWGAARKETLGWCLDDLSADRRRVTGTRRAALRINESITIC